MKKLLLGVALLSVLSVGHAAEGRSWMSYYDDLLRGLKSRVQKKFESKTRVSSVAAVRGSRQGSDADKLYWKGGVSEMAQKRFEEDRKALAGAVQLVVDGRMTEGKTALETFVKDRPESPLLKDAEEALVNLPAGMVSGDDRKKPQSAASGAEGEKAETETAEPEAEKSQVDDRTGSSVSPE